MRKASLTAIQITALVLVILAFAFVVGLIVKMNFFPDISKNICHSSVVLRGTASLISDNAETYVPLKCQTDKYCITAKSSSEGNGDCPDFQGESANNVRVSSVQDVDKFIANEIISCWQEMGEGKISLFSQYIAKTYGVGSVYPTCVICSRIGYDLKSFENKKIDFNQINVMNYMATHQMPDQKYSYYDYLAGEGGKYSISQKINSLTWTGDNNEQKILGISDTSPDSNPEQLLSSYPTDNKVTEKELGILFMQISSPKQGQAALNVGKLIFENLYSAYMGYPRATTQVGKFVGKLCTSGGWIGPVVCGAILVLAATYQQVNIGYNRAVTATKCGDVMAQDTARDGCSVVRTIDYSSEDLSQYCYVVEGGQDLTVLNGK